MRIQLLNKNNLINNNFKLIIKALLAINHLDQFYLIVQNQIIKE